MPPNNQDDQAGLESLEDSPTVVEAPTESDGLQPAPVTPPPANPEAPDPTPEPAPAPKRHRSLRAVFVRLNIYFIIFVLLLVGVGVATAVLYFRDKQAAKSAGSLASQSLSTADLAKLANSGVSVGDPKQVLTVQSNAVFAGKMLVQSDLEVAGRLIVGSNLSLTGISVTGDSLLDDVQVSRNLSVSGTAAVQGRLTAQSLATSGGASFGGSVTAGQLTTNNLNLTGSLTLTQHLVIGGSNVGRSNGPALGSGGTSSVSGSDGAGTVTINTGGSPSAGCFITVSFAKRYNQVPRVLVTPVGSVAGQVDYYVNRTTSSFSICGANPAPAGQSFGFDYFIVE